MKIMGIEYSDLIELIEVIAPQFLMEEWDNSGIQIKTSNSNIEKIMVALEIRDDVIQEAILNKVEDAGKEIKKIGICSGSGASLINDALKNGCDLLITGDIKYHDAQYAKEMGLCLIDAGHYYTERIFSVNFAEKLNKLIGDKVIIIESKIDLNPFGN